MVWKDRKKAAETKTILRDSEVQQERVSKGKISSNKGCLVGGGV